MKLSHLWTGFESLAGSSKEVADLGYVACTPYDPTNHITKDPSHRARPLWVARNCFGYYSWQVTRPVSRNLNKILSRSMPPEIRNG